MANWLAGIGGGALGLSKTLSDQIAREQWERRQQEYERSNQADEAFRTTSAADLAKYRTESLQSDAENRRLVREAAALNQRNLEFNRVRDDFQTNLKDIPGGSEVSPVTWRTARAFGVPAERFDTSATPIPQDFTGPIQAHEPQRGEPSRIKLFPTQQETHAKDVLEGQEERNRAAIEAAERRNEASIAAADARAARSAGNSGSNVVRTVTVVNEQGEKEVQMINARGEVVFSAPAPLSAGMQKESASLRDLAKLTESTKQLGDSIEWAGVGGFGMGSLKSGTKKNTGIGDDKADVLRSLISNLTAEVGHEKYGSALTSTEKAMLRQFAPTINMAPSAIKNRLNVLSYVISTRADEFERGLPQTPITFDSLQDLYTKLGQGEAPGQGGAGAAPPTGAAPAGGGGARRGRFNPATGQVE